MCMATQPTKGKGAWEGNDKEESVWEEAVRTVRKREKEALERKRREEIAKKKEEDDRMQRGYEEYLLRNKRRNDKLKAERDREARAKFLRSCQLEQIARERANRMHLEEVAKEAERIKEERAQAEASKTEERHHFFDSVVQLARDIREKEELAEESKKKKARGREPLPRSDVPLAITASPSQRRRLLLSCPTAFFFLPSVPPDLRQTPPPSLYPAAVHPRHLHLAAVSLSSLSSPLLRHPRHAAMNPTMPPPPPRNPNSSSMPPPPPPKPSSPPPPAQPEAAAATPDASMDEADGSTNPTPSSSMPPPPPPRSSPQVPSEPDTSADGSAVPSPSVSGSSAEDAGDPRGDTEMAEADAPEERQQQPRPRAPYAIPDWSAAPGHPFFLEVIKSGQSFEKLDVSKKGAYMFGRVDLCDFVLDHPTISRFHAVLQFRNDGEVFLYDLGSTHGSSINKTQIKKKLYTKIHVGDIIRFGQSSRLYLFQGPSELMPPEKDMQKRRDAKIRQDMLDREASLARAKTQAALAEGISWGMSEDAPEELGEDEADEITWQTYTGQLTERQQKTRGKIIKRMEKVANMKKEIDAIRVKDISQGGLTQGQQTQIARNEQRISQIMEELENLEETLNDSIQESLGARTGKPKRGSHKASLEEEEVISDDDDFFDRTKKKPSNQQSNGQQSVETADSLLEKKDIITNDIEGKKKLLEEEKNKLAQRHDADLGDDLDAYMSGLSSQLVHDNITKIQKELSDLQAELDKVVYLLKVADPMGEAARKRDLKPSEANPQASNHNPRPEAKKEEKTAQGKTSKEQKSKNSCSTKTEVDKPAEVETDASRNQESANKPAFTIPKPQWLGDKRIVEPEENCIKEANANAEEPDDFVDYKDRKTILSSSANEKDIEEASPGLILRKRKSAEQSAGAEAEPSSVESEASAADAVALLLKHTRGLQTSEETENENEPQASKRKGKKTKQKRVLGPARPDFLEAGPDYETWVPPEGQTGDGRTSLNERLGY
ncbi:hypothetical protein QYE76_029426 [Lolium multiflorum]|uniref:FHA domain-containing protein n=1 Tax=Lolium multiflorum TaxID=4521 RepID=A0AAD8QMU6_LOLMU|nr:hypothetical protein QYE76_029426 [Lolium multiflorum]